jgi:hypothetical protein
MPSRLSDVKFLDQGNILVWKDEIEQNMLPKLANCLAHSNKFGITLAAHGSEVKTVRFLSLEECFSGDDEVPFPNEVCISTISFNGNISLLMMSPEENFVIVVVELAHIYIFELNSLLNKV